MSKYDDPLETGFLAIVKVLMVATLIYFGLGLLIAYPYL